MQEATWPFCGRYNTTTNTVEPFNLAGELAWPFPVESDAQLANIPPTTISYSERVKACLRHYLTNAQKHNPAETTAEDIAWVEEYIIAAGDELNDEFEPCIVMEDYKEGNLVVTQDEGKWQVSGLFDLMEAYFGDGEADLSRPIAEYFNEDPQLSRAFFFGYCSQKALRPGFAQRFPVYMLLDRALLWEFFQRNNMRWWDEAMDISRIGPVSIPHPTSFSNKASMKMRSGVELLHVPDSFSFACRYLSRDNLFALLARKEE